MNLFVLAWRPRPDWTKRIAEELGGMRAVFPQLDTSTLWTAGDGESFFAASMHHAAEAIGPRRYVHRSKSEITFFDGATVSPSGRMRPHDASELSDHWDVLPELLEGRFVVVRANTSEPRIELLLDPIGKYPVYVVQSDGSWLVSNSALLLTRIRREFTFDPMGVGLSVAVGWAGANRTLNQDIHVLEGGRSWIWESGCRRPRTQIYICPHDLLPPPPPLSAKQPIEHVATRLGSALEELVGAQFRGFPDTVCPLTGGRDSRLLASLCMRVGLAPEYYTRGRAEDPDVVIASEIASKLGLDHRVVEQSEGDVIAAWDRCSTRLVEQNDGMVSLWQASDVLDQEDSVRSVGFTLGGIGGEIARRFYGTAGLNDARLSNADAIEYTLKAVFSKDRKFLTPESLQATKAFVRSLLQGYLDQGVTPPDLPDFFYTFERVRRWGGVNARKIAPMKDTIAPLGARAFIKAAFEIPPSARSHELLHRELIRSASRTLYNLPFDKGGQGVWTGGSRSPLARAVGLLTRRKRARKPASVRELVFREKLGQFRSLCLDHRTSSLWTMLDRAMFEALTTPDGFERQGRKRLQGLYAVVTLFRYEQVARVKTAP